MQTRSFSFVFFFISLFIIGKAAGQTVDMVGPSGSGAYGLNVTVLANGNYVVADPYYSEGGVDSIGAVYLYNGSTNALISVLKGSAAKDEIGGANYGATELNDGITALSDGNFIVRSPHWNNGAATLAGAVTWCNGITGRNGNVNPNNSLVGSTANDRVGLSPDKIIILSNGNYVINSTYWNNGSVLQAGAITWCKSDGTTVGAINSGNSLVGTSTNDNLGLYGISVLKNGNYVVNSSDWNSQMGAITWCKSDGSTIGTINSTNSLVGTIPQHGLTTAFVLSNGNYVVLSPNWASTTTMGSPGAITWADGTKGITGTVNSSNSLIGTVPSFDQIGSHGITVLTNNYVIISSDWNNSKGAVTFGNGTRAITGTINSTNSFIGSSDFDRVGSGGVYALNNGNYVISSQYWSSNMGAITWGNGTTGINGTINTNNSLTGIGSVVNNPAKIIVTPLTNGNYVVCSPDWSNELGAATWCKADGSTVGPISTTNSLIGNTTNDQVGINGAVALSNGNYVVNSFRWNNNIGAATWGNGKAGVTGLINSSNSLIGSVSGDNLGYVTTLNNGSYVVSSSTQNSNTGLVTWCRADGTTVGTVNPSNSLIGNTKNNETGNYDPKVTSLNNGNYVTRSGNYNNLAGAVTWGNGSGGTIGNPNNCNSVFGVSSNGGGRLFQTYDSTYNYLLVGRPADNIVSRYYPALGAATPNSNDNSSATISGNSPFVFPTTTGCGQIAALTPSGTNPVSGSVTAKTWLESPQPTYFVARHYEITPTTNPTTSTGTITLYYTQGDFDGFNNQSPAPAALLPTSPNDATGKSHLLVEKQGGVSNVGTGLPGTYPGPITTINPADSNIVWNTVLNRWEVTFDVTGFSGFFIKTATAAIVLPLQLLNFSGTRQGNNNLLQWTTANEVGAKTFVIESSANGSSFAAIGNIAATGGGKYAFTDISPVANRTYYRLKMVDIDGKFTYSNIIWINSTENNSISLYPNPAGQTTTLNINNNLTLIGTKAELTDADGRLLQQINITHSQQQIDLSALPSGVYFLKLKDGAVVKLMKRQL